MSEGAACELVWGGTSAISARLCEACNRAHAKEFTVLLEPEQTRDALVLRLRGAWRIDNIVEIEAALREVDVETATRVQIDCTAIDAFDLSAVWLLEQHIEQAQARGAQVELVGRIPEHFEFIRDIVERGAEGAAPAPAPRGTLRDAIVWVGRMSVLQVRQARQAMIFLGRMAVTGARALRSLHHLRLASITRHIYETGIQAIPIVALIAFLISIIVAYLGAQQLQQFGAEIFTVDLVAISVLREMGVLLTAIIVAGRSGSAFAAEIGVMRLNDEIDALQSMGVDYFEVLVMPRIVGLVIALPLLTIVADAMGLAGGAILSALLLDISFGQFIPRVQDALAPTTFWAGLIKAPVFAILIAMVGCYRGLQVRDSSRELGRLTTVAVVQSIFLVIFADAVFAIVFVELDF
jgi:phospholipid/cholesterol/gamma-HCH transport system permease protein